MFRPSIFETQAIVDNDIQIKIPSGYRSYRDLRADAYELEVSRTFKHLLKPGMNLVDLGANIGYYTLLGSKRVRKDGQVFAFEPVPANLAYLRKNIALNNSPNVSIIPRAVGSSTGLCYFRLYRDNTLGHLARIAADATDVIVVETTTLDDFFAHHKWPRVDMMKIDVEGAEVEVLHAGEQTFLRNPDLKLILEYNSQAITRAGRTRDDLIAILLRLGFRYACIIESGTRKVDVTNLPNHTNGAINLLLER